MSDVASESFHPLATVQFQLTKAEAVRAWRWRLLRDRRILIIQVFGLAMVVSAIVMFETSTAPAAASGIVAVGIWLLGLYVYSLWRSPHRAWNKSPGLREHQTMTFAEEGIETKSVLAEGRIKWAVWKSSFESDQFYLMILASQRSFHIVPKRCISSPDDEGIIRDLLGRHTESHLRI